MGKKFLSQKEVSELTGFTVGFFNQRRCDGKDLPPYIKIGRKILYPEDLFYAWLESKIHHSETGKNNFYEEDYTNKEENTANAKRYSRK